MLINVDFISIENSADAFLHVFVSNMINKVTYISFGIVSYILMKLNQIQLKTLIVLMHVHGLYSHKFNFTFVNVHFLITNHLIFICIAQTLHFSHRVRLCSKIPCRSISVFITRTIESQRRQTYQAAFGCACILVTSPLTGSITESFDRGMGVESAELLYL